MSVELKIKDGAEASAPRAAAAASRVDGVDAVRPAHVYQFPVDRNVASRRPGVAPGGTYASVRSLNAMIERIETRTTEAEVDVLLDEMTRPTAPRIVSFLNAHAVNLGEINASFRKHLMDSDYLLRDGMGVKLMMKIFWKDPGLNLNGTDLIPRILDRHIAEGRTIALIGTTSPWLDKAASLLRDKGANIIHEIDGFRPSSSYVEALRAQPADLIILGMGMPKQEQVAMDLRDVLQSPCLIVNGGAIIDFIADRFQRAPLVMRKLGLEWLYRLAAEPRRLFKRYVVGNAVFLARALWYGSWMRL